MLNLIWIIPLLPLIGVAVNGLFGRRISRAAVGMVGCAVVLASLVISLGAVWELSQLPVEERYHEVVVATWMPLDTLVTHHPDSFTVNTGVHVNWGFALDPLSAMLLLVVTASGERSAGQLKASILAVATV